MMICHSLIFVCWMYGTGIALVVHGQRVRLYCFVCAWTWMKGVLPIDAVWGCNFTLIRYFAINVQLQQWWWRLFVDLCLLNVRNGCCAVSAQTARTCVLLHMRLNLEWRVYCDPMAYEVVISPSYVIYLSTCTLIMAMTTLHWSSFVNRMERVSCCPWTDSAYVFIASCVLEFDVIIGFNAVCSANLISYIHAL